MTLPPLMSERQEKSGSNMKDYSKDKNVNGWHEEVGNGISTVALQA